MTHDESLKEAQFDVYELYDPHNTRVDCVVYPHSRMKDLLFAVESAIDDLEPGEEVRLVFKRYTSTQMEELQYEY